MISNFIEQKRYPQDHKVKPDILIVCKSLPNRLEISFSSKINCHYSND